MRRWNWLAQLHRTIEEANTRAFDYGSFNCGLFAAQCIDAMVEDSARAQELRESFFDEPSAKAFVESYGSIDAAVSARLGEPLSWAMARRGDICLMPTQDGPGLGVCLGHEVAMMTPKGVAYLKLDQATKIWRVD
jgi:hypothetical protein